VFSGLHYQVTLTRGPTGPRKFLTFADQPGPREKGPTVIGRALLRPGEHLADIQVKGTGYGASLHEVITVPYGAQLSETS